MFFIPGNSYFLHNYLWMLSFFSRKSLGILSNIGIQDVSVLNYQPAAVWTWLHSHRGTLHLSPDSHICSEEHTCCRWAHIQHHTGSPPRRWLGGGGRRRGRGQSRLGGRVQYSLNSGCWEGREGLRKRKRSEYGKNKTRIFYINCWSDCCNLRQKVLFLQLMVTPALWQAWAYASTLSQRVACMPSYSHMS